MMNEKIHDKINEKIRMMKIIWMIIFIGSVISFVMWWNYRDGWFVIYDLFFVIHSLWWYQIFIMEWEDSWEDSWEDLLYMHDKIDDKFIVYGNYFDWCFLGYCFALYSLVSWISLRFLFSVLLDIASLFVLYSLRNCCSLLSICRNLLIIFYVTHLLCTNAWINVWCCDKICDEIKFLW
jgi:hypothetical protein